MRPVSQVLPFAFEFLYYPTAKRSGCTVRICQALEDACDDDQITNSECNAAQKVVMQEVRALSPDASYLRTAAIEAGVLEDIDLKDTQYIEFRDNWLRALIAKEQAREQLPESPAPRDESTQ